MKYHLTQYHHLHLLVNPVLPGRPLHWLLFHAGKLTFHPICGDLVSIDIIQDDSLVARTNQILFVFYFPFDKNPLPRIHFLLSCLVVLYLGIVFTICLLLLASWMENLGTIVEVSEETIE